MRDFLKRIKLIDYLTTEIEIQKSDFVKRFKSNVDEGDIGFFTSSFDVFSSSKNELKGYVGFNDFKIKKRQKLFDMNMNMAVAKGSYSQRDNTLVIKTEVNGFSGVMIPFYLFLIIFYPIMIFGIFAADNAEGNFDVIALPFIILHGAIMFGMPYFMMRRSVKRMKYELEREFYFMTK